MPATHIEIFSMLKIITNAEIDVNLKCYYPP